MFHRSLGGVVCTILALWAPAPAAFAEPVFALQRTFTLPDSVYHITGVGRGGMIFGNHEATGPDSGWVYDGTTYRNLGTGVVVMSAPNILATNRTGSGIVTYSATIGDTSVRWGTPSSSGAVLQPANNVFHYPYALNDANVVVGETYLNFTDRVGAIWDSHGVLTQFPPDAGGNRTVFRAIGNDQRAVGTLSGPTIGRAFTVTVGQTTLNYLPLPAGMTSSAAYSINDSGQILGTVSSSFTTDYCIWDAGGTPTLLPATVIGGFPVLADSGWFYVGGLSSSVPQYVYSPSGTRYSLRDPGVVLGIDSLQATTRFLDMSPEGMLVAQEGQTVYVFSQIPPPSIPMTIAVGGILYFGSRCRRAS